MSNNIKPKINTTVVIMKENRRGGHPTRVHQTLLKHLQSNFPPGTWFKTGISQYMIMNICKKLGYNMKCSMSSTGIMIYKRIS